jgi:acyl dehydratase
LPCGATVSVTVPVPPGATVTVEAEVIVVTIGRVMPSVTAEEVDVLKFVLPP